MPPCWRGTHRARFGRSGRGEGEHHEVRFEIRGRLAGAAVRVDRDRVLLRRDVGEVRGDALHDRARDAVGSIGPRAIRGEPGGSCHRGATQSITTSVSGSRVVRDGRYPSPYDSFIRYAAPV